jgi:phosphohistidine phosphatase
VPDHRLLLIRHAQAGNAPLDKDRPLTEQGARDAAAIGPWLSRGGLVPDRVVVSPALRAAQSWEHAARGLGAGTEPVVEQRIYDNTVDGLYEVIRETSEDVATLAVVGHNPSIGGLAHELDDGAGDPAVRRRLDVGFPAGGVAVFELTSPFAGAGAGTATLRDFWVGRG